MIAYTSRVISVNCHNLIVLFRPNVYILKKCERVFCVMINNSHTGHIGNFLTSDYHPGACFRLITNRQQPSTTFSTLLLQLVAAMATHCLKHL